MTNNPFENNMPQENEMPVENGFYGNSPEPEKENAEAVSGQEYTPDNYYQQNYGQQPNADNYAKYGEDYYSNLQAYTQPAKEDPVKANPYVSSYSNNAYQNNSYGASPYYAQPVVKPEKVKKPKKEKKPLTRSALAVGLVVCLLASAVLGTVGGYFLATQLGTAGSGGLSIKKSNSDSVSYHASNAELSTGDIVEKAANSVVEITTEAVVTSSFAQQYIQEGAGSGVIISSDGYIITNYHVIENASQISVTLRNEKEALSARLIGVYEAGDLALIKVEPKTELTAATFGNSDNLKVGDYAVAIGNPLGQLGGTVTDGIISALDREVTIEDQTMNLLQTNAEISPGNSGGGLFNGAGELIGIVNAKSSGEAAEGLGFAIPINDVQDVLSDLKEYGYVTGQVYLGMSLVDISSTAEAWMYGVTQSGVYVASVDNGSNAAEAGFYGGDIITEVNGTKVTTTAEVNSIIDKLSVGDKVTFKVIRNGQTGTLKMELEEYKLNTNMTQNQQSNDSNSLWDAFGY